MYSSIETKIIREFQVSLEAPLSEQKIDSIQLLFIKTEIENHFQVKIEDKDWLDFKTLGEVIEFCRNNQNHYSIEKGQYFLKHFYNTEVNMPQMANNGLSENWLLKEFGAIHWKLISQCLGITSLDIKNSKGENLYSTFVRISWSSSHILNSANQNDQLLGESKIFRYGDSTYCSESKIKINDVLNISLKMVSVFSSRDGERNNLIKDSPVQKNNVINSLTSMPDHLEEYLKIKKLQQQNILLDEEQLPINLEKNIYSTKYKINQFYDINGVGLLYFAAYPIINEFCESEYLNSYHLSEYSTISRDIFYYANCDKNEKIQYRIDYWKGNEKNTKIWLCSTLLKVSDNTILAKIFTSKKKV